MAGGGMGLGTAWVPFFSCALFPFSGVQWDPDDACLSGLFLFCPLSRSFIYALPSSGVLLPVLSGPWLSFLSPKALASLGLGV